MPDNAGLNNSANVPTPKMMRSRIIVGLILGLAGIVLSVVGVVFDVRVLTIIASACAVVGCFVVAGVTLLPLVSRGAQKSMARAYVGSPIEAPDSSVIDAVTELPDGRYFEVAVESRVAAARRHLWPVSIVFLQVGFDNSNTSQGAKDAALAGFADLMRKTLREADIASRIDETTFGLILEDTSEEGGVWTAERLQIALSQDVHGIRRLTAGVAAYPTHGLYSKDVLARAKSALSRASSTPAGHGFGQVEVAHVDLS